MSALERTGGTADYIDLKIQSLRDQLAEAQAREAELVAHVERLREALQFYMDNGITESLYYKARDALSDTPAQSLARLRNEVLEEAAAKFDEYNDYAAKIIRNMKEPEQ